MTPKIVGLAAAVFLAAVSPVSAASRVAVHTVEKGDTLWDLSKRTGCTVDQLRKANPRADRLRIGDELKLPACGAAGRAPAGVARHYVVKRGDTVARIASRHGTTSQQIRTLNRLGDRSMIIVGQRLTLPGKAAPAVVPMKIRVVKGQSVGSPGRGKLRKGVVLPSDPAYYRRRPSKSYGAQHTIDHTRAAVAAVKRKHPRVHRLAIGDISNQRGGPISGHRSHQSGRDIDIGLYFKRRPGGYPKAFVNASAGRLDLAATWALVEALAAAATKAGGPEYIFLDYKVQGRLYKYAQSQGVSKAKLARVFQYPAGRHERSGLVRHEPNHADHLHVRFACPPKDTKCK